MGDGTGIDIYVPNDLFNGCMVLQGFEVRDYDELNWEFKMKPRFGRRIEDHYRTGIGIDRERTDPTELALFDALATWAKLNALFDNRRMRAEAGHVDPPRPLVEEERQTFRRARRFGLVGGGRIDWEVYRAITGDGDCTPPRPRLMDCA